ncbi:MAG: UDP-2,4-diacetamido-2,4,6-trideoxy-beta-L-altropyranose hydrolase [Bermanella sp.]
MSSHGDIVFRVDGDANLGLGHVMRCLTLARVFKQAGFNILFICSADSAAAGHHIENSQLQIAYLAPAAHAEDDAEQCLLIVQNLDVYLLVVDHYRLDRRWEEKMRARPCKLMVIDDLADRPHSCDFLLDSSYGRQPEEYQALTHADCRYLLASDYCLLRPEFKRLAAQARLKRQQTLAINNILINFGATDHQRQSLHCIDLLKKLKFSGEIHVLISSSCQWLAELSEACAGSSQLSLHVDAANVAALMLAADLAIGSVGSSSWERCCLGLPCIGMVVADNQKNIASQLARLGVMELVTLSDLEKILRAYVRNFQREKWQCMAHKAFKVCDGLGAERVKNAVLASQPNIRLRPMDKQDESTLFSWQCEAGNRKYSGTAQPPSLAEHAAWYASALNDASRRMWLVMFNGDECGYVRLDVRSAQGVERKLEEVSVLISQKYRKLGLAHGAITELKKRCLFGVMDAQVAADNRASLCLFNGLGFKKIANNRLRWSAP